MEKLVVLWTSDNKVTAENMVFMYTINAKVKGWWQDVVFIIWGASTELVAKDKDVQMVIEKMIEVGINVRACKKCAENLGVVDQLEKMNIDVLYIGQDFTQYLKDEDCKVVTL